MRTIEQIFTEKAHQGIDCQFFLAELLGEYSWELYTEKGCITFETESKKITSSVQYLFTYSNVSNTLKWAWNNKKKFWLKKNRFDQYNLIAINKIKKLVEKEGNSEFTMPSFAIDSMFISDFNHYDYAYFCSCIIGKPFFICTYSDGELFVILEDEQFVPKVGIDAKNIIKRFQNFVKTTVLLEQRNVFINYIHHHGLEFEEVENDIIIDDIRVFFDENGFYKNSSLTK